MKSAKKIKAKSKFRRIFHHAKSKRAIKSDWVWDEKQLLSWYVIYDVLSIILSA